MKLKIGKLSITIEFSKNQDSKMRKFLKKTYTDECLVRNETSHLKLHCIKHLRLKFQLPLKDCKEFYEKVIERGE